MAKARAKKHYRYIKRGEVIPRDAEIFFVTGVWRPFYPDGWFPYNSTFFNDIYGPRDIRVEVKPRKT